MREPLWRRLRWPQHLHHQLALMVSACLVLALGLLGGYTASEQSRLALRAFETQAAAVARNVAAASANPILTHSLDELETLALHTSDFDEVQSLQLLTPEGRSLGHVRRVGGATPQPVFDSPTQRQPVPLIDAPQCATDEASGRIVAWHPVRANALIGWVRVELSATGLDGLRARTWRNTAVVAVLAVALSVVLSLLWLRRPLRALNRARRFARRLPQAEGEQIPNEGGPLEVRELNASLNEASVLLKQQSLMLEDSMADFQRHEAQLALQNEQLKALFTLSPDGLLTFNREGRVQFANLAFLQLTGLAAEAVLGRTSEELDACLRALADPASPFVGLPACLDLPPQAPLPTLVCAPPEGRVLSLHGQRSQSVSVSQVLYVCDITQQHRLDQMKSEFLSMAAHELRTPMVSIFGFTELMLQREMSAPQRQDLLGRIHRHSQSMVAILNELLDLARIEARRGQDFRLQDHDLAEVARHVVRDFQPPSGRAAPSLVLPEAPCTARVDPHKMQQALLNILSNAYKYSPAGGEVLVRAVHGPQGVGLAVTDHGLGLSPEHLARMGERFFRADKSGNIQGTGLGVSIVKELLGLMGGQMQVDSALGQGTTVTLWLPAPA